MPATQCLAPERVAAPAAPPHTRLRLPEIALQRCTGCGRCVAACGPHLLSLEVALFRKTAVLDLNATDACTGCNRCAVACPFAAIRMRPAPG
jgi:formate hydrogenlyase subunit 6/NADH:ubiquinone oxidoreductase subunit I